MLIKLSEIHPNPLQPRDDNPDISDLLVTMPTVGLLQAIVVKKAANGYEVIVGKRRRAAAIALGWDTIECKVVDVTDPKTDIAAMMAENESRRGFTGKERAAGFQTMIELGFSDEDMMNATGAPSDEIAAARKVATAKKKVVAKMPETASLTEMAGLLEFEKQKDAYEDLAKSVGTDNFEHRLSYQRQQRENRRKVEEAKAMLKEQGVPIIHESDTWSTKPTLRLDNYRIKLPAKEHAACPGHCAYVRHDGEVVYCCSAPKEHGISGGNAPKSDKEKALDKRKRQMRALWRASAPVRQEFVTGKLKAKKVNAALLEWAIAWAEKHGVPCFGGYQCKAADYTDSTDSRVRFVAIAVAQGERAIDDWVKFSGALGKGQFHEDVVAYLNVLAALKYPMSDHEKALVAGREYDPNEAAA